MCLFLNEGRHALRQEDAGSGPQKGAGQPAHAWTWEWTCLYLCLEHRWGGVVKPLGQARTRLKESTL